MIDFLLNNEIIFGKENKDGHFTGSSWIINSDKSKALLTHHAKLNKWLQLGGHSETDESTFDTALREAQEESGLNSIKALSDEIFDIDVQYIPEYKGEKEHFHYDIRFVFEADEGEKINLTEESKEVSWVSLDDI